MQLLVLIQQLIFVIKIIRVRYNDEVIVPAFSFIASINAIKYNNANRIYGCR